MFSKDVHEIDEGSEIIQQLLEARKGVTDKIDEMTSSITSTTSLSTEAAVKLVALHRDYERALKVIEDARDGARAEASKIASNHFSDADKENAIVGAGAGFGLALLATIASGGVLAPLLLSGTVLGAGVGGSANDSEETKLRNKLIEEKFAIVEGKHGADRDIRTNLIEGVKADQERYAQEIQTTEQRKLYEGIVVELLLTNGIKVARQLNQYAQFNGISVDDVFAIKDSELHDILDRVLKGQPKASDVDRLIAISGDLQNQNVVTPEIRTLKQFINHVVIPNKTYFDIAASYADDIRSQDLSTFPPLEILNDKSLTMSGRLVSTEGALTDEARAAKEKKDLLRKDAKVAVRERVVGDAVYHLMQESDQPHLKKMKALAQANEAEIEQYADIFSGVEEAMAKLAQSKAELGDGASKLSLEINEGEKSNKQIDSRIHETTSRNDAKQKAAKWGGYARSALAYGGAIALDMMGGMGAVTTTVAATDTSEHGIKKLLHFIKPHAAKATKDSMHSLSYTGGQFVSTHVENSALDDYMFSLQLQKTDVVALQSEITNVQTAIRATQESEAFQALIHDEAKRSQVAETLLLRSIIRNGYNNSLEIEETCQQCGVVSIDDFLDHYKGTRLGLALKKQCHGIANSNDLSIILAEADCLRGDLSPHDQALKDYVEDMVKPNVASYYSKASKMDVITHHHLTGFGNELHFEAEMQLETARAVSVLLANEFGMSVVGREDVRGMFDFWLHRHGDRRLYDEKIRDGEMSDEYPDKRVSYMPEASIDRFVDMAKRSVSSGRKTFPKVGDMFMRICAYEYFLPQAIQTGGKDNIFTDNPESPSAYPMVNGVISDFVRRLSFTDIDDYRAKIGERLDNVIAQSFIDFFAKLGQEHQENDNLKGIRGRLKDAANYDDYAPVFDRYTKNITRDALTRFDLFLDVYKQNLEKQFECSTEKDRAVLTEQIEAVKELADGKLNPQIVKPGTHEAKLRAHDESHIGENILR